MTEAHHRRRHAGICDLGMCDDLAGLANAVEYASRCCLELGLIAEESVLERDMEIGRIDPHRNGKLIAGGLGFTHLQVGICQVLADGRPGWRRPTFRSTRRVSSGLPRRSWRKGTMKCLLPEM